MASVVNPKDLYLDLIKKCLTYSLWGETTQAVDPSAVNSYTKRVLFRLFMRFFKRADWQVMQSYHFDAEARLEGRDWPPPPLAQTMIGLKRLDNIQFCIEYVLEHNVPGDLIETGVWRGGAVIFMRAVLKAHDVRDRIVWVADSFEGLPPPDADRYPADRGDLHHTLSFLSASIDEVRANFEKYGLLDDQVRFLKGWFKDTLPTAPIDRLAVMRLDGDMYESTMDGLTHLYPRLSPGGFVIIDDFALPACRQAVHDFRQSQNISADIIPIDYTGAYWQKG